MDTFAPPSQTWNPLDPGYLKLKRLMVLLVWGAEFLAVALVVGFAWRWWAAAVVALVGVCWIGYRWWRAGRAFRMWGWTERETDVFIRHGLLFREMVVVPYGRMQVVRVHSGPLERHFGIATVTLETASSGTDAAIPGLAGADAEALRERLSVLGEQQAVGL